MTTVPTCSASRSAASRTVRVTRELCSLERRDGGLLRRWPAPDGTRGRKCQREAHEGCHRVEAKGDWVLLVQRERTEGALYEEYEGDGDERSHREPPAVHGTRRDDERDRGEKIDEPAETVPAGRPFSAPRDKAFVRAVGHEDDGQQQRDAADQPCVSRGDRSRGSSRGTLGRDVFVGGRRRHRVFEREQHVDIAGGKAVPQPPDP